MSLPVRRAVYFTLLAACMPLTGWAGSYDAWRWLLGEDVGTSLAVFFDLQVETYSTVLTLALVLDVVYGLHWGDGGWGWAPRRSARILAYAALVVLVGICAARAPLRSVLEVPLPDDIAASIAQYFRRALEGVLTTLGLMVFLDVVRPGGLDLSSSSRRAEAVPGGGRGGTRQPFLGRVPKPRTRHGTS